MAMATLFATCTPVEYDAFTTIIGTVVDADEIIPINGVSVSLSPSGKNTQTDNNGCFQFKELDAQTYTIQVQKLGYVTNCKTFTAFAGEIENMVIPMKKA